jgi:hypothetical protein
MAGYSGTPLVKKLGIKPGFELYVLNPPEDYLELLHPLPPDIRVRSKLTSDMDFIHIFVSDQKACRLAFTKTKKFLKSNGMLWVSWPKKSSGVSSDLNENIIRDFGLAEGLVDVKVCAVDEVWSGLKFVIRLKDR